MAPRRSGLRASVLMAISPRPATRPHCHGRKRALVRRGSYVPVDVMREERVLISDAEHERNRPEERTDQVAVVRQWRDGARRAPVRPLRRPRAPRRHRRRTTRRIGGRTACGGDPPPDPPPRSSGGLREPAPQHGPRARRLERPRWWVASRAARHQRHAPVGVCALPARLGYGHLDQRDLDVDCPVGWGAAG